MNNVVNLTCLSCCPIVLENEHRRIVTNASTQSDSESVPVAVATIVFADDGVGQGQVDGVLYLDS